MGVTERFKKWKRAIENCMTYRRSTILIITILFIAFYIYPNYITFDEENSGRLGKIKSCIEGRLAHFYTDIQEGNANVRVVSSNNNNNNDESFLPFVGNGFFGVSITSKATIFLKKLRTLSVDMKWSPLFNLESDINMREVVVSNFVTGVVHRYQCLANGLYISYHYSAHRLRPYLFLQDIKVVNTGSESIYVKMRSPTESLWPSATLKSIRLPETKSKAQYDIITGLVDDPTSNDDTVVSIALKSMPTSFEIGSYGIKSFDVPCIVYSETIPKGTLYENKNQIERKCVEELKNGSLDRMERIRQEHLNAWTKIWESGLSISHSKAANALNGQTINATIYYVISNVLPYGNVTNRTVVAKLDQAHYLSLAEGCYSGYHHTLQAEKLWRFRSTYKDINRIVSLWLLTLEKQGCQKLIDIGYAGVMQALLLSLGGFRFSGHHLEFKMDPKFLHRDYVFRRISYDGTTFINITVTLQDDNKAMLGVSIDESDKTYYACDGGCIDEPVKLGTSVIYLPVKLTEPITSILYITSDKSHMELIKDTLHVHKIVEAPAYDHHVIALHRHGHHLGGLPVLFWAAVCFLILIFHLFLFKLIFNEYCDKQDKRRIR